MRWVNNKNEQWRASAEIEPGENPTGCFERGRQVSFQNPRRHSGSLIVEEALE